MRHIAVLCSVPALALGMAAPAGGQALTDPMRPADLSSASAAEAAGVAPSRLQSVLISSNRKLAVIDGRTVPLGGSIDGATLVAIRESEVVLRKGDARETLKFNPGVHIRPVPRLAPPEVAK
jgi:MSHA biogenesis protein MshK